MPNESMRGRVKRPAKPRRTLPGIAAVFSGGRWRWRANITVLEQSPEGGTRSRQKVGQLRDTQRQAFDDVEVLRVQSVMPVKPKVTLGEALQAAIDRKRAEGLAEYSVRLCWLTPAKKILKRFRSAALLETVTADMVRAWALQLRTEEKLAPSTVRRRLTVLDHAFRGAGVTSPIPAVREVLAKPLRPVHKPVRGYDVCAATRLLERARAWQTAHKRPTPSLDVDLLVIELAATTGIRHDELARIQKRDVDLGRGVIRVLSKDRTRPRDEVIVPAIVPRLERRLKQLPRDDSPLLPGYGKPKSWQNPWEPQNRYLNRHRARWKQRLEDPSFHLRALRRAHGSGLDEIGEGYAVIRDALGHTRTSTETTRYLLAEGQRVTEAKRRLASHLLPPVAGDSPAALEGHGPPLDEGAPRLDGADGDAQLH